jgi:hypothetical protein
MKYIPLTKEKFSIIDDEDYERVNQYKWCFLPQRTGYAITSEKLNNKKKIYLHRFILNYIGKKTIDHINHDTLDNRKENLRIVTNSINHKNIIRKKMPKSGFRGVREQKKYSIHNSKKGFRAWYASLRFNNKRIYLGCYFTKEEAALAYNKGAIKYFGKNTQLNMVKSS